MAAIGTQPKLTSDGFQIGGAWIWPFCGWSAGFVCHRFISGYLEFGSGEQA
jgi:hypothetical protein